MNIRTNHPSVVLYFQSLPDSSSLSAYNVHAGRLTGGRHTAVGEVVETDLGNRMLTCGTLTGSHFIENHNMTRLQFDNPPTN